jgi:hypothetical protein
MKKAVKPNFFKQSHPLDLFSNLIPYKYKFKIKNSKDKEIITI